jgi:hypothetical protein
VYPDYGLLLMRTRVVGERTQLHYNNVLVDHLSVLGTDAFSTTKNVLHHGQEYAATFVSQVRRFNSFSGWHLRNQEKSFVRRLWAARTFPELSSSLPSGSR